MSSPRPFRADCLFLGISVMLVMTVVQRGVGFVRGIWFCRLLDDATLGQWAMGYGFLSLVTPMLLLGLPGTLPRFLEHYRQAGQMGRFLWHLLGATGAVSALGVALMLAMPGPFGAWVFGNAHSGRTILALAIAVIAVVGFNSIHQVIAGLRLVRVVSSMQFIQGVGFTILGVAVLRAGGGVAGLLLAFAAASAAAMVPAWWVLVRGWSSLPVSAEPLDARSMWRRMIPYAAALWMMNLLANTFELTDRYMLLHLSEGGHAVGQRLVGQYHSSMIIPGLMISLATMGSGVIMPYLAADWERGRRRGVGERLRRILMGGAIAFTAVAAAALWLSPWIYGTLLEGRYDGGLAVLPLVFVFCIWCALGILAQDYLWVAERGRLVGIVMGLGVAVNFVLNGFLVPRLGLQGAVWGTLVSHLTVLCGIWWASARSGFRLDQTIIWITILPATLLAGPLAASLGLVAAMLVSPHAQRYSRQFLATAGCQFRALSG